MKSLRDEIRRWRVVTMESLYETLEPFYHRGLTVLRFSDLMRRAVRFSDIDMRIFLMYNILE
jgi:hypothetical protein